MAVYRRNRVWWYRFTWNGEAIRESTKQTNKRVAEQIEAGAQDIARERRGRHPGSETGRHGSPIRQDRFPAVLPSRRSPPKPKTLGYYENGTARLLEYPAVADESLDTITGEKIAGYARRGKTPE